MRGATATRGQRVQVMADRRIDRQLDRHGFATFRLVDEQTAALLLAEHQRLNPEPGVGFDADLMRPDPAYRREVARLLADRLGAAVASHTVNHEPFLWNFLCKWPHDDAQLYLHRDWMFVDERTGVRSCSLWVALQDITGHNGQLRVLPGSHRLPSGLSGTNLSPEWIEERSIIEDRLVSLPLRAGEAVVMDHATVHSSFGNHTDVPRVAVGCALRPAGAPLVHFWSDEHEARCYPVGVDFFVDYTPVQLLSAAPEIDGAEVILSPPAALPPEQLLSALAAEEGIGRRLGRSLRRPGPGAAADATAH